MKKVTLIGLESDKAKVVDAVMRLGCLHQEDILGEEAAALLDRQPQLFWTEKIDARRRKLQGAIEFLQRFHTGRKPLFAEKRVLTARQFREISERREELMRIAERVLRLKASFQNVDNLKNKLETDRQSLLPWETYDVWMQVRETKFVRILLGTLPAAVTPEQVRQGLKEETSCFFLKQISQDKLQSYTAFFVHKDDEVAVRSALSGYGFSEVELEPYPGTVAAYLTLLEKNLRDLEEQHAELTEIGRQLFEHMPDLEALFDYLTYRRDTMEVTEQAARTKSAFVLTGYVPAESAEAFEKKLSSRFTLCLSMEDVPEGEEFPVLVENSPLVRPFGVITEMFSTPSSLSFDANAVMAVFYFIFFGMMLSDAGYGLALSLLTGFVLLRFHLSGMMKQMFQLIFLCGISTMVWGALFGGWFGDVVSAVSGGAITIPPLWFNPLDDPIKLLIVSLLLGGIHLLAGLGLQAYKLIRRGQVWDAVFDVGSWYLVLIGLGLVFLPGVIRTVGLVMAIVGALLLLFTQGRAEKNIFKKFFKGLLSLYDITSYLSDLLSYSRLLALGLATGVIAMVINTMSTMAGFSWYGLIILVVGLLVGHVFNIIINTLGAYVHASRLQYVEFFGKFFEGDGQPYRPLQIKSKYVRVEDAPSDGDAAPAQAAGKKQV